MATNEQDLRVRLLNTLLTTPHRDLSKVYPVHQDIIRQDPIFYVHLAAWYANEGEIRDHKEMFVVNLALSGFDGHRDVGLALLRDMPPYQVGRVFDFVKGKVVRRRVKRAGGTEVVTERRGLFRRAVQRQVEGEHGFEIVAEKRGLFRNAPRSMRTEITRYLREREADPDWFDSSVLQARRAIKRLYASLHIAPSARAQAILFDDDPPPDSRLYALKQIARAQAPAEQARAIVAHKIPYRVAATIIKHMTPTVLAALVDRMSPQELINNVGSLKRRGAFDNDDVKAMIEAKLEEAKTDQRVSAYKAKQAIQAADVPDDVAARLDAVTEAQVQAKGAIVRPTALLIDKSGSMHEAIEIGKQIGAMLAGMCEAELYVYAFDTLGYPINVSNNMLGRVLRRLRSEPAEVETTLADWERAMSGIKAGGMTSCGVALEMMRRKGQVVEQIIMVTDEQENANPRFVEALRRYQADLNVVPQVVFVKTRGALRLLEQQCQHAQIGFDAYQFTGDYYALPNLLPLLTRSSRLDLLLDIMDHPLPKRKAA